MDNSNVSKLVVGFFMVIIGVVLISAIANSSDAVTSQIDIVNEDIDLSAARLAEGNNINTNLTNFTVANVPSGWKVSECALTSIAYGNATADFTITTDYDFYPVLGILQVWNTSTTVDSEVNDTFLDYTYCPDDYITIAWGRSIINLIAGFFALAILGIGLGLFYSVFKDSGVMNK